MPVELPASRLLLTERGEKWLEGFDLEDRPSARALASCLTLVSEIEFERKLKFEIEARARIYDTSVALFAVRELDNANGEQVFDPTNGTVNAVPRGTDIGSEGRIASIIRNLARGSGGKLLNHPSKSEMQAQKCDAVFFIDDIVASGKRVEEYLARFYGDKTICSWYSYGMFQAEVIAYSSTEPGSERVRNAKMNPEVTVVRSCPTFKSMVDGTGMAEDLESLCKKYAKRNRMRFPLGFGDIGALMVFEHSCPNNCPQILWGSSSSPVWEPLFLAKSVASDVARVFPPEIAQRDPIDVLIAAGESRMARSGKRVVDRPMPATWLATLSLFSKGIRRIDAVEGVTGLTHRESNEIVEQCVATGLLTQNWRMTDFGRQELRESRKVIAQPQQELPDSGEEAYYPIALRRFEES